MSEDRHATATMGVRSAGERKTVTVLFADVAGYTSISERLDAEDVHEVINGCLKIVLDAIHTNGGTIDKFTGDGVMALFGAPAAQEDHAQRACHAALAIQEGLVQYGRDVRRTYGVDFSMRIGLNSGPVLVGPVGTGTCVDYTAIGDATNLASRIETTAEPGSIKVSGATRNLTKDFFRFGPVEKVAVKGKKQPVEIYKLLGAEKASTRIMASVNRGLTRFVGREKELQELTEAFMRAQSGSGQIVGIAGEAGVGKSRLALEFGRAISSENHVWLEGRCLEYASRISYLPLLAIVRAYFGLGHGYRSRSAEKKMRDKIRHLDVELESLLPALDDVLFPSAGKHRDSERGIAGSKDRVFEAVARILVAESRRRPLVVVIDDAQWIDRASQDFLEHLASLIDTSSILLILLYRPDHQHQLSAMANYSQIDLSQLSATSTIELIRSILGDLDVAPTLSKVILGKSGGNPLFVEEFTFKLLTDGAIKRQDKQYALHDDDGLGAVPRTIHDMIAARIDQLGGGPKRILQLASVIGTDFESRVLERIVDTGEDLASCLAVLEEAGLIIATSPSPERGYAFRHTLTRDVALDSLPVKVRREVHGTIAKALEELHPQTMQEYYERLAYHYGEALDFEKAYDYLRASGAKASFCHAPLEAYHFYKDAIDMLSKQPESESKVTKGIEIRLQIESPMRLLGYPEGSLEILKEGERLSKAAADDRSLACFRSSIGLYYTMKGDPLTGRKHVEDSLEDAARRQDFEAVIPIGLDLCLSYSLTGKFQKLAEVAPKVLSLVHNGHQAAGCDTPPPGEDPYLSLSSSHAIALAWLGRFQEGYAVCAELSDAAHRGDCPVGLCLAELTYGEFFCLKGEGQRAADHLQRAIALCQGGHLVPYVGRAWVLFGWAHYLLGELGHARNHAEKGLQTQRGARLSLYQSLGYCCLAMVHLDEGDFEQARQAAGEALSFARSSSQKHMEGLAEVVLGISLAKGSWPQSGQGSEYVSQGLATLNELDLRPLQSVAHYYLADVLADLGDIPRAEERLREAFRMFGAMGMDYWTERARPVFDKIRTRGRKASEESRPTGALWSLD